MNRLEVEAFFTGYARAFERFDGAAVADKFAVPGGIQSAGRIVWWTERAPIRQNMDALCDLYRKAGVTRCECDVLDSVPMGADCAFAHVHWRLLAANGDIVQSFRTGYELVRNEGAPHVRLVIAYEEVIMRPPG